MDAIILSVGDELVLGQTVDTNSAWVSRRLASVGCGVVGHATVADDQPAIERAIGDAAARCDLLVVSGGLGPTADDLTREALAAVLGAPLVERPEWIDRLADHFERRGRVMQPGNRKQATIPAGAALVDNPVGTAAGVAADLRLAGGACRVYAVPGVPKEMRRMVEDHVVPFARAGGGGAAIVSRTLHTFGRGESDVAALLGDRMMRGRNPSVGTTVSGGVVSLRLNSRFESPARASAELDALDAACRAALGDLIYGQDDDTLPAAVGRLLVETGGGRATVTTAESCTGGLLAKMLTDAAGSSAYFGAGFVTYSNAAKYERLGVNRELLSVYGAVSESVVEAMARGARRLAKATYALAVSGVAGPAGGSDAKPVGTVCVALAYPDDAGLLGAATLARTFAFPGDRETVRDRSAKMALAMLRYHLLGAAMPF